MSNRRDASSSSLAPQRRNRPFCLLETQHFQRSQEKITMHIIRSFTSTLPISTDGSVRKEAIEIKPRRIMM